MFGRKIRHGDGHEASQAEAEELFYASERAEAPGHPFTSN